jgi:hypothetical protein
MDEKMLRVGGEAKRRELYAMFDGLSLGEDSRGQMTADDEKVARLGDYRQAEGLNEKKAARQQK